MSNAARVADGKRKIPEAIHLYELLIAQDGADLIDYLNLICIYFNCLDLGYVAARKVSADVEENCSTRALELIDEAEEKFGKNDELTFWKYYIPFYGWGDEIGEWELIGDSLVPFIHLAMEDKTNDNIKRAQMLYSQLKEIDGSERKEMLMGKLETIIGWS